MEPLSMLLALALCGGAAHKTRPGAPDEKEAERRHIAKEKAKMAELLRIAKPWMLLSRACWWKRAVMTIIFLAAAALLATVPTLVMSSILSFVLLFIVDSHPVDAPLILLAHMIWFAYTLTEWLRLLIPLKVYKWLRKGGAPAAPLTLPERYLR